MPVKFTRKSKGLVPPQIKRALELSRSKSKVGMPKEKNVMHSEAGIDIASLMTIHEYGSQKMNIPSRPFGLLTANKTEVRKQLGRIMGVGYKKAIAGASAKQVLSIAGEYYAEQLKQTINEGKFTPLSILYAARKNAKIGHEKILIRSGEMRDSITHVEVNK